MKMLNDDQGFAHEGKMQTYQRIADKYSVSLRTVIRWQKAGCDITDDEKIGRHLTRLHSPKLSGAITVLETQKSLFDFSEVIDTTRKKGGVPTVDRIKALIESRRLKEMAKDLAIYGKTGVMPKKKNQFIRALYLMKNKRNNLYKIGVSNTPRFRERTLQSQEPEIEMVGLWPGLSEMESAWHKHFKEQRVRGEWFALSQIQVEFMVKKMISHG
jgi:hypothetical protein